MIDDAELNRWFCREVLPLERSLTHFIRRNLRVASDVVDARQDIYARVLAGARKELPMNAQAYVHTVARNHLINIAQHAKIVSIELVAELDDVQMHDDLLETDRYLGARDELRRAFDALDALPPRCREVVRLRKVEGYSIREAAVRMGVGVDTVERQLTLGMRAIANFMRGGAGKIDRGTPARRGDEAAARAPRRDAAGTGEPAAGGGSRGQGVSPRSGVHSDGAAGGGAPARPERSGDARPDGARPRDGGSRAPGREDGE